MGSGTFWKECVRPIAAIISSPITNIGISALFGPLYLINAINTLCSHERMMEQQNDAIAIELANKVSALKNVCGPRLPKTKTFIRRRFVLLTPPPPFLVPICQWRHYGTIHCS
jgi:hypothetical protein